MHTDSEEQLLKHFRLYTPLLSHSTGNTDIPPVLCNMGSWQSHLREDDKKKSWFICLQKYFKSQLESVTLPSAYFCQQISEIQLLWMLKFYSKFINYKFKKLR